MCKENNCQSPVSCREYCKKHYERFLKCGKIQRVRLRKTKPKQKCSVDSCMNFRKGKGLCQGHLTRFNKHGNVMEDKPLSPSYIPHKNIHGYLVYKKNNKRILVHREVMENHLGRKLLPHETVHHINGDRSDNRIENLELWSTNQPKGQRVKDKIAWAEEILKTYSTIRSV